MSAKTDRKKAARSFIPGHSVENVPVRTDSGPDAEYRDAICDYEDIEEMESYRFEFDEFLTGDI